MTANLMMQLRVYLAEALGTTAPIKLFPYTNLEEYFQATDAWLFALR